MLRNITFRIFRLVEEVDANEFETIYSDDECSGFSGTFRGGIIHPVGSADNMAVSRKNVGKCCNHHPVYEPHQQQ